MSVADKQLVHYFENRFCKKKCNKNFRQIIYYFFYYLWSLNIELLGRIAKMVVENSPNA